MKILSYHTFLGQQGINLIERRIQSMGFWWYPAAVPEVGIDGHLEIRDSQTGKMTNLIVQVQSKATERPWSREQLDSFDYICDESDLNYWLAGNAPVIIVFSRPSKDEAYWVAVKDYFRQNPDNRLARRISIKKSASAFDASAADAILHVAAPRNAGTYLSPRPKVETLYSNLLEVSYYATDLFVAKTDIRDFQQIWDEASRLKQDIGPEWILSDGNIYSFHDLSEYPWCEFCDPGTMEILKTVEWAQSDDEDSRRMFVRLLNHSLRAKLQQWEVRRRKSDDMYYFAAASDFRPRRIEFAGPIDEQYRTVVQKYPAGRGYHYIRHLAFKGFFKQIAEAWYLEITPSYLFTTDGRRPYRFEEEQLAGIKRLERNDAVLSQIHLWVDILKRSGDLVHAEYPFLKFGRLLEVELSFGINEKDWLEHEDLDESAERIESLSKRAFPGQ